MQYAHSCMPAFTHVFSLNCKERSQNNKSRCAPIVTRAIENWIQSNQKLKDTHSPKIAERWAKVAPRLCVLSCLCQHGCNGCGIDGQMARSPFLWQQCWNPCAFRSVGLIVASTLMLELGWCDPSHAEACIMFWQDMILECGVIVKEISIYSVEKKETNHATTMREDRQTIAMDMEECSLPWCWQYYEGYSHRWPVGILY